MSVLPPDDELSRCLFTGIFTCFFSRSSSLFEAALLFFRQPFELGRPSALKNLLSFVCFAFRNFFTVLGERGELEICTIGLGARFEKFFFFFVFFVFPPCRGANLVSPLFVFAESHCPQPSARLDMIFQARSCCCVDSKWRANLNSLVLVTYRYATTITEGTPEKIIAPEQFPVEKHIFFSSMHLSIKIAE